MTRRLWLLHIPLALMLHFAGRQVYAMGHHGRPAAHHSTHAPSEQAAHGCCNDCGDCAIEQHVAEPPSTSARCTPGKVAPPRGRVRLHAIELATRIFRPPRLRHG